MNKRGKKIISGAAIFILFFAGIICCCLVNNVQAENVLSGPSCHGAAHSQQTHNTDSTSSEGCECAAHQAILMAPESFFVVKMGAPGSVAFKNIALEASLNSLFPNGLVSAYFSSPPKMVANFLPIYFRDSTLRI